MNKEIRTYLLDVSREEILNFLDANSTFVEVGVAEGRFSQEILDRARPSHLTLIDSWRHLSDEDYLQDRNNVSDNEQEARFQSVCKKFARHDVAVIRELSLEAVSKFADASLDYIYLDAMHTYDAVLDDLNAWWPKLAPTGLFMGHDYANHVTAKKMGFDVVRAVNHFVSQVGCVFAGVTNETYPSFILAKSQNAAVSNIHRNSRILCSFSVERLNWELTPFPDGCFKAFPSL